MTGPALATVAEANRLGVKLAIRGGKLVFSPKSLLTPELFQRLKAHRAAVLAILATRTSLPSDGDPGSDGAAEKPAQSPADDLPADLRPFAHPEDTGSLGYRRHLARIRRAAAAKESV